MADHDSRESLLGNGYYLDLVGGHGLIVLRREDDDTEVARFSVWDATSTAIEEAARKDLSTRKANTEPAD